MKFAKSICCFLIASFSVAAAFAQQAAPAPTRTIVRAGKLLDVRTGKTLTNQSIIIEDGKIVSVGPDSGATGDAKVIDLSGKTVLPGLIDAHTHLTYDPRFGYDLLAISLPREALIGAKNARLTLLAGFTTVRNVGACGFSDVALRDAINAGEVPGPRMSSGPALSITGGHCDDNLLPYEWHATDSRRRRRNRGRAAQGAREHQVRRRPDQDLRHRRSAFARATIPRPRNTRKTRCRPLWPTRTGWAARWRRTRMAPKDILLGRRGGSRLHRARHLYRRRDIAAMKQHGTYLVPTLYLDDWMLENGHLPAFHSNEDAEVMRGGQEHRRMPLPAA